MSITSVRNGFFLSPPFSRQSVQYVAEFWLYFKSQQSDPVLCERLQLEFDRLVLYTVFYGVSSKG